MNSVIGIDVGGTNLRVGLFKDHQLIKMHRTQADFSALCREASSEVALINIVETLQMAIHALMKNEPTVQAVGIGFPGFINPTNGILASSPNLPGLLNVDIAGLLQSKIAMPVKIENDALCAAYGEYCLQQTHQPSGLIYIGLGTGVGGGLIYQATPLQGEHGYAMEIGHLTIHPHGRLCGCGNLGCLEQYASATGISHTYREFTGQDCKTDVIAERAQQGEKLAQASFDLAASTLAQGVAHILKVIDVVQVVIGGGVSQAWPLIKPVFDQTLDLHLIPVQKGKVQVRVSTSQDKAGMLGAAYLALNAIDHV
jgi:glucokinase